jgi:hypothetical protein
MVARGRPTHIGWSSGRLSKETTMRQVRVVALAIVLGAVALASPPATVSVAASGPADFLVLNQAADRGGVDVEVRAPFGDLAWAGGLAPGAASPSQRLAAGRVEVAAKLPGQYGRTLRHQWRIEAGHAYCAVVQILANRPRLVLVDVQDVEQVAGWPAECGRMLGLAWVDLAPVHVVRKDLAQDLGIERRDVEVVRVEPREWPNSGMGCTDEGLNVLPVITKGYEVILRAGSVEAVYHTDDGWFGGSIGFVRCR